MNHRKVMKEKYSSLNSPIACNKIRAFNCCYRLGVTFLLHRQLFCLVALIFAFISVFLWNAFCIFGYFLDSNSSKYFEERMQRIFWKLLWALPPSASNQYKSVCSMHRTSHKSTQSCAAWQGLLTSNEQNWCHVYHFTARQALTKWLLMNTKTISEMLSSVKAFCIYLAVLQLQSCCKKNCLKKEKENYIPISGLHF